MSRDNICIWIHLHQHLGPTVHEIFKTLQWGCNFAVSVNECAPRDLILLSSYLVVFLYGTWKLHFLWLVGNWLKMFFIIAGFKLWKVLNNSVTSVCCRSISVITFRNFLCSFWKWFFRNLSWFFQVLITFPGRKMPCKRGIG